MAKPKKDPAPVEDPDETIIEEFMQGSTRARHLTDLCDALRVRIRAMRDEAQRMEPSEAQSALESRIRDTRQQLAVLNQELAISEFVEESVRVALHDDTPDLAEFEEEYE